ncbi:GNAT family protein [Saccharomonospora sp.]|uniref:GNAT family N-acetyltransferase n=1 Tax=Saccharomonospora sp. TaxID=33913 RepID=UPI00260B8CB6|nr:GNAT family protein [Saccharomonospora sp.]
MRLRNALPVAHADVLLRPLAERDAVAYAEGTTDDAVRRFAHLPLPEYTAETVRTLVRTDVRAGLENGTLAVLTIADAVDDIFLGSLVLFDITAHTAEVGFWLSPNARGLGVATKALTAAVVLGDRLGLHTLTARTDPANTASRRTLVAAGFETVGAPHESTAPSGAHVRTQHYRLRLN